MHHIRRALRSRLAGGLGVCAPMPKTMGPVQRVSLVLTAMCIHALPALAFGPSIPSLSARGFQRGSSSLSARTRMMAASAGALFLALSQDDAFFCSEVGETRPTLDTHRDDTIRAFLVRHGAVDLTQPGMTFPKDCMYGGHNVPLSDLGKLEARAAAEFLKDEDIDLIFCSPLDRALYGAERVAEKRGLTPIQDDGFREVNRGRWLGLTREQIQEKFPGDFESFGEDPSWCEHGGETYTQLFNRVLEARDRALNTAREKGAKTICIVSHMWVTKSMITDVTGIQPTQQDKWSELLVPTASISQINYPRQVGGGKPEIVYVGTKPEVPQDEAAKAASGWGG